MAIHSAIYDGEELHDFKGLFSPFLMVDISGNLRYNYLCLTVGGM